MGEAVIIRELEQSVPDARKRQTEQFVKHFVSKKGKWKNCFIILKILQSTGCCGHFSVI